MKAKKVFNDLFLILAILCILYYIGMGVAVRFGQSLLWLWPFMAAIFLLRYFLVRTYSLRGKPFPLKKSWMIVLHVLILAALLIFSFVEFFVVSHSFEKAPSRLDTVIVLGAKVNGTSPSGALRERIETAAEYLKENPDTLCIASGGQGEDEGISEAECIRRGLVERGIDPNRILLEEESENTAANLNNSFRLLPEGTVSVGILTNDFHVFRAISMARFQSTAYEFSGISARSSVYGYVHYAMREFFSIGVAILRGNLSPSCFFS